MPDFPFVLGAYLNATFRISTFLRVIALSFFCVQVRPSPSLRVAFRLCRLSPYLVGFVRLLVFVYALKALFAAFRALYESKPWILQFFTFAASALRGLLEASYG